MATNEQGISDIKECAVTAADTAKQTASHYLNSIGLSDCGLVCDRAELDARKGFWRVAAMYSGTAVGTIVIDVQTGYVDTQQSSTKELIEQRMSMCSVPKAVKTRGKRPFIVSPLQNMVIKGRAERVLRTLPEQVIDLVFTSPPYYNARTQYAEYATYNDYLLFMQKVLRECHRVLIDGKFLVINTSPVLIPRTNRQGQSSRIGIPFDLHRICIDEGFEFVDDIIWKKPDGAGFAYNRDKGFAKGRNPMQYKAAPVTEYVMVYRKKSDILIDHFLRNNPNPEILEASKIADGYEKTNVWCISPAKDKRHPAIFPSELADKVICYYSFVDDVVLDPFGGLGTTAKAAKKLGRRFCTIERMDDYIAHMLEDLEAMDILSYFDFKDLSDLQDNEDFESFEYLVGKLLDEGYSKSDLCAALRRGLTK